jgi:ABC-type amino acid transport substrate-binding protein
VKLAGAQTSVFPVGIATTKKDVDLHDSFAAALRAIRANGTYNQIVSRWNFQSMVPQN